MKRLVTPVIAVLGLFSMGFDCGGPQPGSTQPDSTKKGAHGRCDFRDVGNSGLCHDYTGDGYTENDLVTLCAMHSGDFAKEGTCPSGAVGSCRLNVSAPDEYILRFYPGFTLESAKNTCCGQDGSGCPPSVFF